MSLSCEISCLTLVGRRVSSVSVRRRDRKHESIPRQLLRDNPHSTELSRQPVDMVPSIARLHAMEEQCFVSCH